MATRIGRLALYFGTLMAVETPIMLHFRGNMNGFAILWMLLGVVIHFLVFVGIGSIVGGFLNRYFEQEYNAILEEYKVDNDAQKMLHKLKNMKHKRKSALMHNAYYFTLSRDYYELGEKYAALNALNTIYTIDPKMAEAVEKQRKLVNALDEEE